MKNELLQTIFCGVTTILSIAIILLGSLLLFTAGNTLTFFYWILSR